MTMTILDKKPKISMKILKVYYAYSNLFFFKKIKLFQIKINCLSQKRTVALNEQMTKEAYLT